MIPVQISTKLEGKVYTAPSVACLKEKNMLYRQKGAANQKIRANAWNCWQFWQV